MPISSYVLRCLPADQPGILNELIALPGIAVGQVTELGIAVAADTGTTAAAEQLGERLHQLPGVKSAVLVYHNFEDVAQASPWLPDAARASGLPSTP